MSLPFYQEIIELQKQGELDQAIALCVKSQESQIDIAITALLGTLYCQIEEFEMAKSCLDKVLASKQNLSAFIKKDIAGIYLYLGLSSLALQLLNEALIDQPDLIVAQLRRGLVFLQTGQFEKARQDFYHGLNVLETESHLPIFINLARCAISENDCDEALKYVLLAQQQGGEKRLQWLLVAIDTYIALEQWQKAEQVVQLANTAGVDANKCLKLIALVLAAQNKHDEAEHHIRQALKRTPEDIELLVELSVLANIQGHYGESLHCLQTAVKLEPENSALWAQIAQISHRHFSANIARYAAEKALDLTEQKEGLERAEALVAIAVVEVDCNNEHLAEQYYLSALDQISNYIPACLGMGHLLLQWGRIDEAVERFEEVTNYHPVTGYGALINARKFPENEEILTVIEKVAYTPSLKGPVQSSLLFDLAAVWEHKKCYSKAFHFVAEANEASRKYLPYSADEHRKYCVSLMQFFNTALYEKRKNFGSSSNIPVFVLGMPRSGTTLVEQILSGHSEIYGAGELGIMGSVIQRLNSWEQHIGSGKRYPECIYDLSESQSKILAKNVLDDLQTHSADSQFIVDKLPHNFENIGLIRLLFPNAAIIHVLRDARDVAVSNFFTDYQAKFGGMGFAYDLNDIAMQLVDYNNLMCHWDNIVIHPVLTIRYEDVVDDTEGQAKKMLDYIGVDWSPEVLNFQDLDRAVKTASIWQVRQPIYKTSKQKWRRYESFIKCLDPVLNAQLHLDTLAVIEPLSAQGAFFNGMEYLNTNKFELASAIFKMILADNPKHATALHMLGITLLHLDKQQQALVLLEQSIELQPNHSAWYDNLSLAYQKFGLLDKANTIQEKAKKLNCLDIKNEWWEAL